MDDQKPDRLWDWIRRAAGLLFLTYIIFADPPTPAWVGLLIAGLLGLPDVIAGQIAINLRDRREREEDSESKRRRKKKDDDK